MLAVCFAFLSIVVAVTDIVIAHMAFQTKSSSGRFLGWTAALGCLVIVSYLASVLCKDYFPMAVFSAVYFAAIDAMLACLVIYIAHFTRLKPKPVLIHIAKAFLAALVFDIVIELLNPFTGAAISYDFRDTPIAHYSYNMKPLFVMHLCLTYSMVAAVFVMLLNKTIRVPHVYRGRYSRTVLSILFVVAVNAIFLYVPALKALSMLDYSVLLYSVVLAFMYWNSYIYKDTDMINHLHNLIMNRISQGIVVFDYDKELVYRNEISSKLLPTDALDEKTGFDNFVNRCGFSEMVGSGEEEKTFQHYFDLSEGLNPVSCEYKPLYNSRGEVLGRLFTFTDTTYTVDPMTGFLSGERFENSSIQLLNTENKYLAAVCDINKLTEMNRNYGREMGDRAIIKLSNAMRLHFPADTVFVRAREAYLAAICSGIEEEQIAGYFHEINDEMLAENKQSESFSIQWAISAVEEAAGSSAAIETAIRAMRSKKLMDEESGHSQLLTSLVRALEECDPDTEAHVMRTQKLGAALGERLGLTDLEQSELSLLCIMHDIGKIGIPLEILNKPGKLTAAEYETLKSHVWKGYQIAQSSPELHNISEMILHHHERWDGKGYPDGLSKESIPILSRIIAVVDTYDAMVNDRSYRPACSRERALTEITACAGSQFDPRVAAEFVAMQREMSDVRNEPEPDYTGPIQEIEMEDEFNDEMEQADFMTSVQYSRYTLGSENHIIDIDDRFEVFTGYSREDLKKYNLKQNDLIPEEDRERYDRLVAHTLRNESAAFLEHRLVCKDGHIISVICYGRFYYDSAARERRSEIIIAPSDTIGYIRTVKQEMNSKTQNQREQWERKYRQDPLTGLMNREAFASDVSERVLNPNFKVAFLMIDLNKFKEFNDTYGHAAGDSYLIEVARSLNHCVRASDITGRMGGDEFAAALVFPHDADPLVIMARAYAIYGELNEALGHIKGSFGAAMGCAVENENLGTFSELYKAADKELYTAKKKTTERFSALK